MRLTGVGLLAFLTAALAVAQTPPARDTSPRPPAIGSAVIKGRVIAADTKRPLRRAKITISGAELSGENRTTSTDADGRFELTNVPAGRFTIRVTRSGFLALRYGQRQPTEQAKPLDVHEKEVVENVDFALPRMSVITGRVLDELGDPIEGVNVYAMKNIFFNGHRQLAPVGVSPPARTDDAGEYRLLGLAPGTYLVSASTKEMWTTTTDGVKRQMAYLPTYYPGTATQREAQRITVKAG